MSRALVVRSTTCIAPLASASRSSLTTRTRLRASRASGTRLFSRTDSTPASTSSATRVTVFANFARMPLRASSSAQSVPSKYPVVLRASRRGSLHSSATVARSAFRAGPTASRDCAGRRPEAGRCRARHRSTTSAWSRSSRPGRRRAPGARGRAASSARRRPRTGAASRSGGEHAERSRTPGGLLVGRAARPREPKRGTPAASVLARRTAPTRLSPASECRSSGSAKKRRGAGHAARPPGVAPRQPPASQDGKIRLECSRRSQARLPRSTRLSSTRTRSSKARVEKLLSGTGAPVTEPCGSSRGG